MKGEIGKLRYNPLTLDAKIVKDGLEAVATLTDRGDSYVVGGVAAQSYLPSSCRRPTSDIDISVVRPLNYEDFKQFSKPVRECLSDQGYDVDTIKKSRSFGLEVFDSEDNNLLIEFSRRNEKSFARSESKLVRELENSRKKLVEDRNSSYGVASPEDIIVPKLVRCIGSLNRMSNLENYFPSGENVSTEFVNKRLDYISRLRETSIENPADKGAFEKLKFVSDIYDIRLLSVLTGVNKNYFLESSGSWDQLKENKNSKIFVLNFVPKL